MDETAAGLTAGGFLFLVLFVITIRNTIRVLDKLDNCCGQNEDDDEVEEGRSSTTTTPSSSPPQVKPQMYTLDVYNFTTCMFPRELNSDHF